MGRHGKKTERLFHRLTPKVKADLRNKAEAWGMNLSQYVDWLIAKDLYSGKQDSRRN